MSFTPNVKWTVLHIPETMPRLRASDVAIALGIGFATTVGAYYIMSAPIWSLIAKKGSAFKRAMNRSAATTAAPPPFNNDSNIPPPIPSSQEKDTSESFVIDVPNASVDNDTNAPPPAPTNTRVSSVLRNFITRFNHFDH